MPKETDKEHADLYARLREIEERFEHEMRMRGFDPAQADNVALPGPLAKLYTEREQLRTQLQIDERADEESL